MLSCPHLCINALTIRRISMMVAFLCNHTCPHALIIGNWNNDGILLVINSINTFLAINRCPLILRDLTFSSAYIS